MNEVGIHDGYATANTPRSTIPESLMEDGLGRYGQEGLYGQVEVCPFLSSGSPWVNGGTIVGKVGSRVVPLR